MVSRGCLSGGIVPNVQPTNTERKHDAQWNTGGPQGVGVDMPNIRKDDGRCPYGFDAAELDGQPLYCENSLRDIGTYEKDNEKAEAAASELRRRGLKRVHWCHEWDYMLIDAECPEIEACPHA